MSAIKTSLFKKDLYMANYIGYFCSCNPEIQYSVRIITNPNDSNYTEIMLSSDEPFVIDYDTSETIFSPIRYSTATINIVSENYLEDALPDTAQGTIVELWDETNNKKVWNGYLTSTVYSQPYDNCYNRVSLNANDNLQVLQFLDYQWQDDTMATVSFAAILNYICNKTNLDGYYYSRGKSINGHALYLEDLRISERNFYSSDTWEPWKLSEVLEEICRYLGYTAFQDGNMLILLDYLAFSNNDIATYNERLKEDEYTGTTAVLGSRKTIASNNFRGNGGTISFAPVYNKIQVRDSFYKAEYLAPDLYKEEDLTYRLGASYEYIDCLAGLGGEPTYFNKNGKLKEDAKGVSAYKKYMDNRYYVSNYYDSNLVKQSLTPAQKADWRVTRLYAGGTLYSTACIKTSGVTADAGFKNYLLISQKDLNATRSYTAFETVDDYTNPIIIDSDTAYALLDCSAIFTRYTGKDWINPDWTNERTRGGGNVDVVSSSPVLWFKLKINGLWWDGTSWGAAEKPFRIILQQSIDDYWNRNLQIDNTMSWDLYTGGKGHKIPLAGLNTGVIDDVYFAVQFPQRLQVITTDKVYGGSNSYCFIDGLSLKIVNEGAETADKDTIYENVINARNVNELSDITCRITTIPSRYFLSYSHVGYGGGFLTGIEEANLSGTMQKPEENLIEKYYNQYSTPTITEDVTLDMSFEPYDKIRDTYWNKDFVVNGMSIDYKMGKKTITLTEIK